MAPYPYGRDRSQERGRLAAIERAYDPGTIRHLLAGELTQGWRCLEVAAGGGSIAKWLCKQVGPNGYVVATDVDTDFLDNLSNQNLDVRRHNIVTDDLEQGAFDLVHSRLLLDILPEREKVLAKLVGALKPGGQIVLEEFDPVSMLPACAADESSSRLFMKVQEGMRRLWLSRGFDAEYGRKLAHRLHSLGLERVAAEGCAFSRQGGTAASRVWYTSVEALRRDFTDARLLSAEEIDQHLDDLDDPTFFYFSPMMVTAWAYKPV
jgi:SAM-dependent methyltransferase